MMQIKIHEQLARFRKEKGWTQEALAQALGVSNQAVSKWESAQCCPDIQLLPEIARLLGISVDELLGQEHTEDLKELCDKVRRFFQELPEEETFDAGFRMAALLHEAMLSGGYKRYLPWNPNDYANGDKDWGISISHEPEGSTLHIANNILFTDNATYRSPDPEQYRRWQKRFAAFGERETLRVFFALYELTFLREDAFATAESIAEKANLPVTNTETILETLPVQIREDRNEMPLYRLKHSAMHLPALFCLMEPAPSPEEK